MKIHILDDWFDTLRNLPCFAKLNGHEVTVWTDHIEDIDQLAARFQDAEALVLFRERTKITRALLEKLPNLKLISQRGAYPHVDVQACSDNNILFCSKQPKGNAANYAAVELTWALILAAMRQLPQQMASLKSGKWQTGVGKTLRGRTLGVYGFGRIGQAVAEIGKAFGMDVIWWSSKEGRKRAESAGAIVAKSRESFFSNSDVLTLHIRLKPGTKSIIKKTDLMMMGKDALFVNTSRAGLLEKGALLSALNAGRPGMAAVDVFDQEPLNNPKDALLSHANLIGTPHIGFVTEDEFNTQFSDIFDQIIAFEKETPIHIINPEILVKKKQK